MEGQWDRDFRIVRHHWKEGRGVVTCSNEKTAATFIKMTAEIDIGGQKFRAWPAI